MKNTLLVFFTVLLASTVSAEQGYKRDPFGSTTWTGSGRPPHFQGQPEPPVGAEELYQGRQNRDLRYHDRRRPRVHGAIVKMCEGFDTIHVVVNGRHVTFSKNYIFTVLDTCPGAFTETTTSSGERIMMFTPKRKGCL